MRSAAIHLPGKRGPCCSSGEADEVQSFSNIDANLYIFVFSRVLNSTMFESWAIVGPYPSWWLFNFLLLVLQVLHIIWAYLIARIAIKAMLRGKVSPRTDRVGGGGWRECWVGTYFPALPSEENKWT